MIAPRAGLARAFKVLLVERRLPIRWYKFYYNSLNRLGIRFATVRLKNGMKIKGYTNGLFMLHETWTKHEYDIESYPLAKGMTVVDIGANQGFFSLYAASKGATVYAFEPCSENFDILRLNVTRNGYTGQVRMFKAAVTGRGGQVVLFVGLDGSGDVLSATASTCDAACTGKEHARLVESVTLDSLMCDLHIERCDFLKMDCEGAEYEILRATSQETFLRIAAIAMECHGGRIEEAAEILEAARFGTIREGHGWLGILKAKNTQLGKAGC